MTQAQRTFTFVIDPSGPPAMDFVRLLGPVAPRVVPEPDASITRFESVNDTDTWGLFARFSPPGAVPGSVGFVAETAETYGWSANNFYDAVLGAIHYAERTGNATVRQNAYALCRNVANNARWVYDIEGFALTGDYNTYHDRLAPRDCASLGIMLAVTDPRTDAATLASARAHMGRLGWWMAFVRVPTSFGDPREDSYQLMGTLFAGLFNLMPPWQPARTDFMGRTMTPAFLLDNTATRLSTILAYQRADGTWPPYGANLERPTYMHGMLAQAMALYDDWIGDARILPSVLRLYERLLTIEQRSAPVNYDNASGSGGLWYSLARDTVTPYGGNVYPTLNGLYLDGCRYLHERTGDSKWLEFGNRLFDAMSIELAHPQSGGISTNKECNQVNRGARWLQYRRAHA